MLPTSVPEFSISGDRFALVLAAVERRTGVPTEALTSSASAHRVTRARAVAAAAIRIMWGVSHAELGRMFAGRDHTTMIYAVRRADPEMVEAVVGDVRSGLDEDGHDLRTSPPTQTPATQHRPGETPHGDEAA